MWRSANRSLRLRASLSEETPLCPAGLASGIRCAPFFLLSPQSLAALRGPFGRPSVCLFPCAPRFSPVTLRLARIRANKPAASQKCRALRAPVFASARSCSPYAPILALPPVTLRIGHIAGRISTDSAKNAVGLRPTCFFVCVLSCSPYAPALHASGYRSISSILKHSMTSPTLIPAFSAGLTELPLQITSLAPMTSTPSVVR